MGEAMDNIENRKPKGSLGGEYSTLEHTYESIDYEYNTLMSALNVSVSKHMMDDGFTCIWANDFYYQKTGYTEEEYNTIYNRRCADYFKKDPGEFEKISKAIETAVGNNKPGYECVCKMHQKGGTYIWIKVVGTFTKETYNGFPIIYTVFTDITDIVEQQALQKELEERSKMLFAALEMAERANRSKSDFLSRMSHDIRTPMNAILGMISIAKESMKDPVRVEDCLNKAEISANFLLSLINDILDMSKIESGKMVLKKKDIAFASFIQDITTIVYAQAKEKDVQFYVNKSFDLCENYVGDELKIKQILINLIGNAIKFTEPGGKVELSIARGESDEKLQELIFIVKDTGIGMDEAFLDKIFLPFEQDFNQNGNYGGSGLGLAIAANYAHMMNGSINVESKRGEGSAFTVKIWLDTGKDHCKSVCLDKRFGNRKVLVAATDFKDREYMLHLLDSFGVRTESAATNNDAMEILLTAKKEGKPFSEIIINYRITEKQGIELAKVVRKVLKNEVNIAICAYSWSQIHAKEQDLYIDYFLQKPLFPSTIYDFLISMTQDKLLEEKDNIQFSGERILLVEDNEINMEIAQTLLQFRNLEIDSATNGLEAVESFKSHEIGYYKAILMDIQMPVMNGFVATEKIRALDRADAKTVPIIAMTADAFDEDVEKCIKIGMNSHISKPVSLPVLYEELNKLMIK